MLKSIEHSEKLRGCLNHALPQKVGVQKMAPAAIVETVARVEAKLDMFVDAVMYKLDVLYLQGHVVDQGTWMHSAYAGTPAVELAK